MGVGRSLTRARGAKYAMAPTGDSGRGHTPYPARWGWGVLREVFTVGCGLVGDTFSQYSGGPADVARLCDGNNAVGLP